jgi:epsilon-lactone hydrolase
MPTGPTAETLLERMVAAVLRFVLRLVMLPTFRAGRPLPSQRTRLEAITRVLLPARQVGHAPGVLGGVPGEFVRVAGQAADRHAILYLHGGAYCVGSPRTHRALATHLARRTRATLFVADYRLAPEHPFPAAVDDAVAAYRGLLERGHAHGDLAIVGDSAGGGLALATALKLRDLGLPLPAALVVFSPWVDLDDPERGPAPAGEVMVSAAWTDECARLYLGGHDARDPYASPVHGDLRGLPPVLVQVGQDELLLGDSRRLAAALAQAGVGVQCTEFPRRWHVFQANAGLLADADRALDAVSAFLRQRWAG